MKREIIITDSSTRAVFEALSAVVTKIQRGESQPHTVVSGDRGHYLVGIESVPAKESAAPEAARDVSAQQ